MILLKIKQSIVQTLEAEPRTQYNAVQWGLRAYKCKVDIKTKWSPLLCENISELLSAQTSLAIHLQNRRSLDVFSLLHHSE